MIAQGTDVNMGTYCNEVVYVPLVLVATVAVKIIAARIPHN